VRALSITPGPVALTLIVLAMQPIVLSAPTIAAISSSLMLFCTDTTQPFARRYGMIILAVQAVSYDFVHTSAISTGSLMKACT